MIQKAPVVRSRIFAILGFFAAVPALQSSWPLGYRPCHYNEGQFGLSLRFGT
jgi:hypothetical protein